jgi:hypothetical protein
MVHVETGFLGRPMADRTKSSLKVIKPLVIGFRDAVVFDEVFFTGT